MSENEQTGDFYDKNVSEFYNFAHDRVKEILDLKTIYG